MNAAIRPHWAPRVPPKLIRRLYEDDAAGLLDEQLLDDVGIRLYLRCQSIIAVHDVIHHGQVSCPQCGGTIPRDRERNDVEYLLQCTACAWELPWRVYWATFRHNELAYDVFVSDYMTDWEKARTPQDKMLAIDRVIHRWHNDTKQKRERFGLGRPAGVNLIEGSRQQVIEFLDSLTAFGELKSSFGSSWRSRLAEVRSASHQKQ
jgi:hypothetical protein